MSHQGKLTFSVDIAEKLGLDAAIVLELLRQLEQFRLQRHEDLELSTDELCHWLPFFSSSTINQAIQNLEDNHYLSSSPTESGELCISLNKVSVEESPQLTELAHQLGRDFRQANLGNPLINSARRRNRRGTAIFQQAQEQGLQMDHDWSPGQDFWQLLKKRGITDFFANEHKQSYILRHIGRRRLANVWDADFLDYVVRKWQYAISQQGAQQSNEESNSRQPTATKRGNYDINSLDF